MFSLRAFNRAIPRTFSRSLTTAVRPATQSVSKPSFLQSTWRYTPRTALPAFSTASRWMASQVDRELTAKFTEELGFELDPANNEQDIEYIEGFLKASPFKLQDTPGADEVVMTRKFGEEDIKVVFSIADLKTLAEEPDLEDNSLVDEYDDVDSKGQKLEQSPDPEALDEKTSYPARVSVTIQKAGKGAVHVEVLARDGLIQVEDVQYYKKPELASPETASAGWDRQALYTGPPFGNLDEDLQVLLERYLDERGIDSALASFIPEYMEFKEQKEYVNWLQNLKEFVEA